MTNTNSQASGRSAHPDEEALPGLLDSGPSLADGDYVDLPSHEADASAASPAPVDTAPGADTTAPLADTDNGPNNKALMWHDDEGKGRIPLGTNGFLDKTLTTVRSGRRENALIAILQHAQPIDIDGGLAGALGHGKRSNYFGNYTRVLFQSDSLCGGLNPQS